MDEQAAKYDALDAWFKTASGLEVSKACSNEIKIAADCVRGNTLVQLGSCGDNLWLPLLDFRHKWIISPSNIHNNNTLQALLTALPLERNSIDCVIAPLTLEAFGLIKNPIDEIDRILKPMGYVIFFGINPWSLWGAAYKFGFAPCFGNIKGLLSSPLSLKYALEHRGYTQCMLNSFYYTPPVKNASLIRALSVFNEVGKMIWPYPAGFYCLIAQKYQPTPPLHYNMFKNTCFAPS